jgi:CubicO group peptidase (beta-lactamase class C family)
MGSGAQAAIAWQGGRWSVAVGRTSAWRAVVRGGERALVPRPGAPVTLDTQFDVASLTKPMATLTLLAQALSAPTPHLHLDDRLADHLPEARGTALGPARIAQLLGHGAGAAAEDDFWPRFGALASNARCRSLIAAVLDQPLAYPAGSQAVYSDLGYLALGWLIESLGSAALDIQFAARVAQPLGLATAYRRIGTSDGRARDVAVSEIWPRRCPDGDPLRGEVHDDNAALADGVAGHAGLFACADDVAEWALAWLEALRGRGDDATGPLRLAPSVVRALTARSAAPNTTWRLGFDTPTRPGSTGGELVPDGALVHLGFTGCSVWLVPHWGAVVVLLTNRVHPSRSAADAVKRLRPAFHDAIWPVLERQP